MKYAAVTVGSLQVPWPALAGVLAAAPLFTVVALRTLYRGPAGASAGQSEVIAHGQFVPPSVPRPTPEAVALQMTFDAECNQPFGASPMVSKAPPALPKQPTEVVSKPDVPENPNPAPQIVSPPTLNLTSIMGNKGQPFAVLSGKVRRVGDQVGGGFSVTAIDPVAGTVEIAHPTGVLAVLRLKNLGGE